MSLYICKILVELGRKMLKQLVITVIILRRKRKTKEKLSQNFYYKSQQFEKSIKMTIMITGSLRYGTPKNKSIHRY
jgi:hypothetical protein